MSTYEIRPRLQGTWIDAGEMFEDVEAALIEHAATGEPVWLVRNNFNGSVNVFAVTKHPGWRPTLTNHGSYETFYGCAYREAATT